MNEAKEELSPNNLRLAKVGLIQITLTYGHRWNLLQKCLDASLKEGITRFIVIDNASQDDIASRAKEAYGNFVNVIRMSNNVGSAPGMVAGIDAAIDAGALYFLLMDDDNELQPGALDLLLTALQVDEGEKGLLPSAVTGFREDHTRPIVEKALTGSVAKIENSCIGFHVADIPHKLVKLLRGNRQITTPLPEVVSLPFVPYSGMLFNRAVPLTVGKPEPRFCLYIDDTEFSYRLTKIARPAKAVTNALILDNESSWSKVGKPATSFGIWSVPGSERQVYYFLRNVVFWDWALRKSRSPIYFLNCFIFYSILFFLLTAKKDWQRLKLLYNAIKDGYSGKMGPSKAYPLA